MCVRVFRHRREKATVIHRHNRLILNFYDTIHTHKKYEPFPKDYETTTDNEKKREEVKYHI